MMEKIQSDYPVFEIESATPSIRKGTNDRGNWEMAEQVAWMHKSGELYPVKVKISLRRHDDGHFHPYPVGKYVLSPDSFYVGQYDSLRISPILLPLSEVNKKAA